MAWTDLIPFLGVEVSGDLGGYTIYTNKNGKKVWYPISPPMKPPTQPQLYQRMRFQLAQWHWKQQTAAVKQTWELLSLRLSAPATGQNLWISYSLRPDDAELQRYAKRVKLTISPPPAIPE